MTRVLGVAALFIGSLQLFAPWRWAAVVGQLIVGRESCPDMTALDIYEAPTQFYRCAAKVMWRIRPSVFDDLVEIRFAWSSVAWLAGVGPVSSPVALHHNPSAAPGSRLIP